MPVKSQKMTFFEKWKKPPQIIAQTFRKTKSQPESTLSIVSGATRLNGTDWQTSEEGDILPQLGQLTMITTMNMTANNETSLNDHDEMTMLS